MPAPLLLCNITARLNDAIQMSLYHIVISGAGVRLVQVIDVGHTRTHSRATVGLRESSLKIKIDSGQAGVSTYFHVAL